MEILIWPGTVILLGVIFMLLFRPQISEKLKHVKQVNRSGVTFTSPEEKGAIQVSARDVSDLFGSNDSRLIIEMEDSIKSDLAAIPEQDKMDHLIRHLALAQIYRSFEQYYAIIFGSQISLLKKLNEALGRGRDSVFIKTHFQHVQELFAPDFDDWTVDTYMKYLFDCKLVTQQDNMFHITIRGIGFLVWLTKAGRGENKAL
jgi:hypothetical protein